MCVSDSRVFDACVYLRKRCEGVNECEYVRHVCVYAKTIIAYDCWNDFSY